MNKCDITLSKLQEVMERKNYRFFESGDYNVNLIGIRSSDTTSNAFNDVFVLATKQCDRWQLFTFDCTTDPGLFWRKHPMNPLGTAVLVPGQYSGAYRIGKQKDRFDALVQSKILPVYRDNDCDNQVDVNGLIDTGWHGINIHPRAEGLDADNIGKWSAGCQVLKNYAEHMLVMSLCKLAREQWGDRFTYTLLEETDFR